MAQAAPLLWPEGWHLRCRMLLCALVLVFSRVCNMLIPLCYKVSLRVFVLVGGWLGGCMCGL